jgi:hypothetical protein
LAVGQDLPFCRVDAGRLEWTSSVSGPIVIKRTTYAARNQPRRPGRWIMTVIEMNAAPAAIGTTSDRREDDRLPMFLAAGLELAGSCGKAALALLMGAEDRQFVGRTADWAALRMLVRVTDEFARRALSDWERERTAAVVLVAAHRLDENLRAGFGVREDDFFVASRDRRAPSDEAAEAILLVAQREHEEAKLPFLGNLLTGVAFRDGIDRAQVNSLVRLAAGLSHRQLCLLDVFSHTERLELRLTDYNEQGRIPFAVVAVLQDVFEMVRMCLVFQTNGDPITLRDLTPGRMTVAGMGAMLFKLMGLNHLEPEAIDDLAALLR